MVTTKSLSAGHAVVVILRPRWPVGPCSVMEERKDASVTAVIVAVRVYETSDLIPERKREVQAGPGSRLAGLDKNKPETQPITPTRLASLQQHCLINCCRA